MPNLMMRIVLFVSSYAPLLAILSVRKAFGECWGFWVPIALAVTSTLALLGFLAVKSKISPHSVEVSKSNPRDGEAMSYIVSYLLPFIGLDSANVEDRISLGIFLAMVAVLYVGSNLIHMNPTLNLIGFRLLEIEHSTGKTSTLICRKNYITPGTSINVVSLSNHLLLEKK